MNFVEKFDRWFFSVAYDKNDDVEMKKRSLLLYKLRVWDLEILVRVPAIKTCFMSIDEMARIFSKPQSL